MAKRTPITISGTLFTTKKAAIEAVREIINPHPLDAPLTGTDHNFILDLLSRHTHWKQKRGCGIDSIVVRENTTNYGKNRGLYLIRTDGSEVDISWRHCVTPKSLEREAKRAARDEIAGQRSAFRDHFFKVNPDPTCEVSGERLTQYSCHVDHIAPKTFDALFSEWAGSQGVQIGEIITVEDETGLLSFFEDRDLALSWQRFHQSNAELRVITATANLTMKRKVA